MEFAEEQIDIEELKTELKADIPSAMVSSIHKHNAVIAKINEMEEHIDSFTPLQYAKLEHYYNKAEREAWKIAGYYKSQYQYFFGRATTERGNSYIHQRETEKRNINDSNYASRVEEGKYLEISGINEGYYVTWKGIAQSYNGAVNTMKDLIKAAAAEGGE